MYSIYKHYNQSELNRQYNNRLQTPDYSVYLERYETTSLQVSEAFSFDRDIAYGNHQRERMDIFHSGDINAPVLFFIHAGYWRAFDKSSFRFIAPAFLSRKMTVVLISYPLAPESDIDQILVSCEKALSKVTEQFKGDIFLLGHSAGAHLATMLLTKETGFRVKGIAGLSGIYNMIPIQLSDINESLKMDDDIAKRNSPAFLKPVHDIPVLVAVGEEETDEFKAQANELSQKWNSVSLLKIKGSNHFSIIEMMADRKSDLFRKVIEGWNI